MTAALAGAAIHAGRTLDRFEELRQGWERNEPLRTLYAYWFAEIQDALSPVLPGTVVELGSGPAFVRQFMPWMRTSDIVRTPDHDYQIDATAPWPFRDGSLDGLLLFDVLHHLSAPSIIFREATRALRRGGRLVMMEPYVSPLAYPFYRFLHVEGLDPTFEPFACEVAVDKDPFEGNQSVPRLIFEDNAAHLAARFPFLRLIDRRLYSGLSYVATGGFGHLPLVPRFTWSILNGLDRRMPVKLQPLVAFRMLVCLERL
ncbi:MAG: methyltransferase domain-containing protein [Chloroflexi bacterium]|nr:methyltransferase domain-containing protein [Chloroflexota bacterium]MBV9894967.1 methyltransferase domain-containing protein [Chloroflexota bacterium]